METQANRNSNRLKSVFTLICCLFLTGCETLSWVQVNPPAGTHLMPRPETAEIIAITDKVASQFGMRRLSQAENNQLAAEVLAKISSPQAREFYVRWHQSMPILVRYQINSRLGLLVKTLQTYYLSVSYTARGNFKMPEGSVILETSEYMPDERKILDSAKGALAEKFTNDRVFIGHYRPFNF